MKYCLAGQYCIENSLLNNKCQEDFHQIFYKVFLLTEQHKTLFHRWRCRQLSIKPQTYLDKEEFLLYSIFQKGVDLTIYQYLHETFYAFSTAFRILRVLELICCEGQRKRRYSICIILKRHSILYMTTRHDQFPLNSFIYRV